MRISKANHQFPLHLPCLSEQWELLIPVWALMASEHTDLIYKKLDGVGPVDNRPSTD